MHVPRILTTLLTLLCVSLTAFPSDVSSRVSSKLVKDKLRELDKVLVKRAAYLDDREKKLDSISCCIGELPSDTASTYLFLGDAYASYSVGHAIKYLEKGFDIATKNNLGKLETEFRLALARTYPLNGYIAEGLKMFNSVDYDNLPSEFHSNYFCTGEKMYETILDYYSETDIETAVYEKECAKFRQTAMRYFAPESPDWLLREAKQYFAAKSLHATEVSLYDLIGNLEDTDPIYTEATNLMAKCYEMSELEHDRIFYLAANAISETKRGDREGVGLHIIGQELYDYGDIGRSHSYLSKAVESIPDLGAQSFRNDALIKTLMTIDNSYSAKLKNNILILSVLVGTLALCVVLISLSLNKHKHIVKQLSRERYLVAETNKAKKTFMKNFLELGSISGRRLLSFNKIVNRKITSKQYADLYEMSKSGKIIEDQRKQFFKIFDESFLSIYPNFINELNTLLRDEEKYELTDKHLPSELRVIALACIGIDDSTQMAESMGFSINTIYAYRAKVRNKAINKSTFDCDITKLEII